MTCAAMIHDHMIELMIFMIRAGTTDVRYLEGDERYLQLLADPGHGSGLGKTVIFWEFSLCLSRACLGKRIVFLH